MRFALRVALLALSFGIGTWILGWWAIPLFAAMAAVMARDVPRQAVAAGIAGAVSWGTLLAWSATQGSIWSFARLAGGAMGVSGLVLILMALAFPAVLAWSATVITRFVARGKPVTN